MRAVPHHPSICWLCAGTGWVCEVHPEKPFFPTKFAAHCDCSEGVRCPLLEHGVKWFVGVGALLDRCAEVKPRRLRAVA